MDLSTFKISLAFGLSNATVEIISNLNEIGNEYKGIFTLCSFIFVITTFILNQKRYYNKKKNKENDKLNN